MSVRTWILVAATVAWFVVWYAASAPLARAVGRGLGVEVQETLGGTWETVPPGAPGWVWAAAAGIVYHALLLVPVLGWWLVSRR